MAEPLNVLIVEDNQADAELIVSELRRAGFKPNFLIVENEKDFCANLKPELDLILSDYKLPHFTGLDALRILNESKFDIPLIIISGAIGEELAVECMREGAEDYLFKDRLKRMGSSVRRAVEQRQLRNEHHQMEERIRKSEEQFRDIFESANVGKSITSFTGNMYVNQAFANMVGYSREELSNKTWQMLTPEEEIGSIQAILASLLEGENRSARFDKRYIHKNGSLIWADLNVALRRDKEGKPDHFITTIIDISERKQTEKALRLSEERFSTAFHTSPDAININRLADGLYIEVNEGFLSLTGYTKKEVIGKSSLELTIWGNPEDRKILTKGLQEHGEVTNLEAPFRMKNGDIKICLMSARTIEIDQEMCILSITRDITERKQAEQAVQKERDNAKKYLDIAEVMIAALNKKGEITLINKKGSSMLGYKPEELIGKNFFENFEIKSERKESIKAYKEFVINHKNQEGDHFRQKVLTKSGDERIIEGTSIPLWEWIGNEKIFTGSLSSAEDITEHVRAEHFLTALNNAAISMGAAQSLQEVFEAVAKELKKLDMSCMLFPFDIATGILATKYINYEPKLLTEVEKLTKIRHDDFSFSADTINVFQQAIGEKQTILIDDPSQIVYHLVPKMPKKVITQIIKTLNIPKVIIAPLLVDGEVIGLFSIFSNQLNINDIQTTTAFAHQLAGAWNKTKLVQDLRKTVSGTIHTIAATVELRDPYTAGHQARVGDLSAAIAQEMHLTDHEIEGIRMAGIIHDIGKIQIPAEILSKPGKLSALEFDLIKTHSQVGFDLIKEIEFPWPIAEMILQHHEKLDGSGYPQGLKGDAILLTSKILSVADMVEAMSSYRPYRPSLGLETALAQIKKDRGTLLDPNVVDACLKLFKEGYVLPKI